MVYVKVATPQIFIAWIYVYFVFGFIFLYIDVDNINKRHILIEVKLKRTHSFKHS